MRKVKGCRLLVNSELTASLPDGGPESPQEWPLGWG
jgi:hypothetical protein